MNERIKILFNKFSRNGNNKNKEQEQHQLAVPHFPPKAVSSSLSLKTRNLLNTLSLMRINLWNTISRSKEESENEHPGTHSLDVLEGAVKALVEVAIPADIARLNRHKKNIARWKLVFDIRKLKREYELTDRTIKKIAGSLQELEILRLRVMQDDLAEFDDLVHCVSIEAQAAIQDFMDSEMPDKKTREQLKYDEMKCLDRKNSYATNEHCKAQGETSQLRQRQNHSQSSLVKQRCMSQSLYELPGTNSEIEFTVRQQQKLAFDNVDGENTTEVLDAMVKLQKDVEDLNEMMKTFSSLVQTQTETVDTIADNVDSAEEGIRLGNIQLKKANIFKAALFPTVGAIVGGAVGGPIGALAGLKLGTSITGGLAAAGVTGGLIGYQGGKYLKKQQTDVTNKVGEIPAIKEEKAEEDFSSMESFEIITLNDTEFS